MHVGSCRLGTSFGPINASQIDLWGHNDGSPRTRQVATLVAVTDVLPAGVQSVGIDCNQYESFGAIVYEQARVVGVALSGG